jgi:hypothetical protein
MTTRWRRFRTFASLLGLCMALSAAGCAAPVDADADGVLAGDEAVAGDDTVALADSTELRVSVLWGKMPGAGVNTPDRDWSGSFVVSRGSLHVMQMADFEGKDRILGGTRANAIAFRSGTSGDVDGISFSLVDPTPGEPILLTYVWQGYAMWSVTIDSFDGASAMFTVGDGNGLTLFAVPAE